MSVQVQHRRDSTANVEANTPAAGELWWDTTKNELSMGNGALGGGVRMNKKNIRDILAPAQIVANTNDYSPSGLKHAAALRLTTDAARNLTGLVPLTVTDGVDGRQIALYNAGSFNIVVQDQNAASAAANRFDLGGADITLAPKQSVTLRYSSTISRWEIAQGNYGQALADNVVSARKLATSSLGARVGLVNGTLSESHTGNAVTFALKTLAGTDPSAVDPVYAVFNNGSGGFVVRTITAALALTISSGSSMGVSNASTFRLWLMLIDTGSAAVLGAVNCVSGGNILPLPEYGQYGTTAEGGAGAADSAQVIYSAAAQTNRFMCLVGYADYDGGLVTAGAWAASPTRVILFGPGVQRPGDVVAVARLEDGTLTTGTTLTPFDDTIPQSSEGNPHLQLSYSPSAACNMLSVACQTCASNSAIASITLSLFRDSGANALKAITQYMETALSNRSLFIRTAVLAGSVTATTFKTRVGANVAGGMTINGANNVRVFGGVMNSFIEVIEHMG